jgi:hypothetical protein
MTSYMSFMTNGWNMPHHVLSDYYSKQLVYNDFNVTSHSCPLWPEY